MKMYGANVSLQYTCYNVEVVCVTIRGTDFYFRVFMNGVKGLSKVDK